MVDEVTSPMPGTVVRILAENGDEVEEGDVLLILETMKMENEIIAPTNGKVKEIVVNEGDKVKEGALLSKIERLAS